MTASPSDLNLEQPGSGGLIAVTVDNPACVWTASSDSPWITIAADQNETANGTIRITGNGTLAYGVTANPDSAMRTGMITLATQGTPLTPCSYTVSPPSLTVRTEGGSAKVRVATGSDCAWNGQTTDWWLNVLDSSGRTGPGTLTYTVAANATAAERTGSLTVAGQTVPVTQLQGASIGFLRAVGVEDPPEAQTARKFFGYYNAFGFTAGADPDAHRKNPVGAIGEQKTVTFVMLDPSTAPSAAMAQKTTRGEPIAALVTAPMIDQLPESATHGRIVREDEYKAWKTAVKALGSTKVAAVLLDAEPACQDDDRRLPLHCDLVWANFQASARRIHTDPDFDDTPLLKNMPALLIFSNPGSLATLEQLATTGPDPFPDIRGLGGFDCYHPWDTCRPDLALNELQMGFVGKGKFFVLVPPAFASVTPPPPDSETFRYASSHWLRESDAVTGADQYQTLIDGDPTVVALLPFLWTYQNGTGGMIVEGGDPTKNRAGARENLRLHRRFLDLGAHLTGLPAPSVSNPVSTAGPAPLTCDSAPLPDGYYNCHFKFEWTAQGLYGTGVRAYLENTPRTFSMPVPGCESTWSEPPSATHTCEVTGAVPPGRYRVEVVGIGADASSQPLTTSYSVIVPPQP